MPGSLEGAHEGNFSQAPETITSPEYGERKRAVVDLLVRRSLGKPLPGHDQEQNIIARVNESLAIADEKQLTVSPNGLGIAYGSDLSEKIMHAIAGIMLDDEDDYSPLSLGRAAVDVLRSKGIKLSEGMMDRIGEMATVYKVVSNVINERWIVSQSEGNIIETTALVLLERYKQHDLQLPIDAQTIIGQAHLRHEAEVLVTKKGTNKVKRQRKKVDVKSWQECNQWTRDIIRATAKAISDLIPGTIVIDHDETGPSIIRMSEAKPTE